MLTHNLASAAPAACTEDRSIHHRLRCWIEVICFPKLHTTLKCSISFFNSLVYTIFFKCGSYKLIETLSKLFLEPSITISNECKVFCSRKQRLASDVVWTHETLATNCLTTIPTNILTILRFIFIISMACLRRVYICTYICSLCICS
jgi:hypothetical protein